MYNTIDEIERNGYLNILGLTCSEYDVYCTFYDNTKSKDKQYSGIFFVMGLDENKVFDKDIKIPELINDQKIDKDFLHLDINAVQITDKTPFMINRKVVEFCKNAELIKRVHEIRGREIPKKINNISLEYIRALYEHSIDLTNKKYIQAYRDALNEFIASNDAFENPNNPEHDKVFAALRNPGYKLSEWVFYKNNRNLVPLMCVLKSSNEVIRTTMNKKLAKQLDKEMKKYPDIMYWHSKPLRDERPIKVHRFKNVKKYYDSYYVDVVYGKHNANVMDKIITKLTHPEIFKYNIEEIDNEKDGLCYINVSKTDASIILECLSSNNVKAAIDYKKFSADNPGEITIVINSKDANKTNYIIKDICKAMREKHIYNKDAENTWYFQAQVFNPDAIDKMDRYEMALKDQCESLGIDYKENRKKLRKAMEDLLKDGTGKDEEER